MPLSLNLVLLAAALLSGGARRPVQDGPAPVAVVQGTPISAEAFRSRYADVLLRTGMQDDLRLRKRVLSDLIGQFLLEQEALRMGLDRTEAYRFEAEQTRRRLLLDRFSMVRFYDAAEVTDEVRAEVFARMHTQITARHLYARTHEAAQALKARLDAGETFEALAREVFADSALAHSGGFLGTFGFDEMDPAFERAAFHLPIGEVSEPVQTATGFSIIRVEARTTAPILTEAEFARKKPHIDAYARRNRALEARAAYADAQRAALAPVFTPALADLYRWLSGQAVMPDPEVWTPRPLVTFGPEDARQTWTLADFQQHAAFVDARSRSRVTSERDLEAFVTGLIVQQQTLEEAARMGLADDPDFRRAYDAAMTAYLVRQRRDALTRVDEVPEDSLRAHFARYGADMTTTPRVEVSEILVETLAEAQRLRAEIESGTPFEMLAARHSTRPGAVQTGGSLGFATHEELGVLGPRVFAAAQGDLLGPVEVAGRYALLRVGPRMDARPLTFDEARPALEAQLRQRMGARRLAGHLIALRDAADVQIDFAALAAVSLYD